MSKNNNPDAMLLALKASLLEAWANERTLTSGPHSYEQFIEANDATSQIVDQIKHIRARTIEGLRVKALAVYRCHRGDVSAEYASLARDEDATDVGLLWSIGLDLIAMEAPEVPDRIHDAVKHNQS